MDIQNVQSMTPPTRTAASSGNTSPGQGRISEAFRKLLQEVEARRAARGVQDEDTQARFAALVEKYLGPESKEHAAQAEPAPRSVAWQPTSPAVNEPVSPSAPSIPAPPADVREATGSGNPPQVPATSLQVGQSGQITYTVQSDNESLSEIAYKFYGKAGRYVDLARVNQIQNPDIIHAGQKLIIPQIDGPVVYDGKPGDVQPQVTVTAPPAVEHPLSPQDGSPSETTYQVQSDSESLSEIAHRFYGKASRYMDIARANGIQNPDIIHAGQTLIIPGLPRPAAPAGNPENRVAEVPAIEVAPEKSTPPLAAVPAFSETSDQRMDSAQLLHDGKPVRVNLAPAFARTESIPEKPTAEPGQTYTVQRDDETLSEIAKRFYGKAGRYMEIARANGIQNPDIIHAGQKLILPALDSAPAGKSEPLIAARGPKPSEERKIFSMMLHFQGYQQLNQDYPRVMISDLPAGNGQEQL